MNTKDLIITFQNGETFGTLAEKLIDDAEALIKLRRAFKDDGMRSCYLEQDSKYKSMCRKLDLPDPDQLLNYMKTSKRIKKSIFHEEPKSQADRRFMLPSLNDLILAEAKRQSLYEETCKRAAASFVSQFDQTLKVSNEMIEAGEMEKFTSEAEQFVHTTQVVISLTINNILVPMTKSDGKIGALQCLGMITKAIELVEDPRFEKKAVGVGFFRAYTKGKFPATFDVIWGD